MVGWAVFFFIQTSTDLRSFLNFNRDSFIILIQNNIGIFMIILQSALF